MVHLSLIHILEKKGAQNPAYIRNPDVEMFLRLQEAAHGLVRLITCLLYTSNEETEDADGTEV